MRGLFCGRADTRNVSGDQRIKANLGEFLKCGLDGAGAVQSFGGRAVLREAHERGPEHLVMAT